jgi:hypothetical protein
MGVSDAPYGDGWEQRGGDRYPPVQGLTGWAARRGESIPETRSLSSRLADGLIEPFACRSSPAGIAFL